MVEVKKEEIMIDNEKEVNVGYSIIVAYLWGWVSGLIIYLLEKNNRFLKWNAMQSIILSVSMILANLIFGFIPYVGRFLVGVISIVFLVFIILVIVNSFKGIKYKIPGISVLADKWTKY